MPSGASRKHANVRRRRQIAIKIMPARGVGDEKENKTSIRSVTEGMQTSSCCHRQDVNAQNNRLANFTSEAVLWNGPGATEFNYPGPVPITDSIRTREELRAPLANFSFGNSEINGDYNTVGRKGECFVCGIPCTLSCSGCRKVYYCGREHQRKNWNEGHKFTCYPWYDMTDDEHEGQTGPLGKGPYLKASKDFLPMEKIYEDRPLMTGPGCCAESEYEPVCLGCCSIITKFQKCSSCRWPVCGPMCEVNNLHFKYECEIFTKNNVEELHDPYQYELVRILRCLLTKNEDPDIFDQLMNLDGALEQRKMMDFLFEATKTACMFVRNNCKLEEFDDDTINHMCGVVDLQTRPFGRYCSMMQIFPFPSVLLHSCNPNVRFIEIIRPNGETMLEAVAVRNIKKGEPLTLSLVLNVEPTYLRQKYLMSQYYFNCKCVLCMDPIESGTFFSATKCPICSIDIANKDERPQQRLGYVIPLSPTDSDGAWVCNQCKCEFSSRVFLKRLSEIEKGYWEFKYDSLRKMSHKDRVKSIKDKIQEFEKILHPCNFLIWKLKRYLINVLTERLVMVILPTTWKEIKDTFVDLERNARFVMTIIKIRQSSGCTTEKGECLYDLVAGHWSYIQWAVAFRKASSFKNHRNFKEFLQLLNDTVVIFSPEVTGGNRVSASVLFMKDNINEINKKASALGKSISPEDDGDCFEEDRV